MKTSTKIFLVAGGLLVVLQAVLLAGSVREYRRLTPAAQKLAADMSGTEIRVVSIRVGDPGVSAEDIRNLIKKDGCGVSLSSTGDALSGDYVSGDTLHLIYAMNPSFWPLFRSPALETVIIRRDGVPDEILDYGPAPEPLTDAAQE